MCGSGCATWVRRNQAERAASARTLVYPAEEGRRTVAMAVGLGRQLTFWIATCVVIVLAMWLLREILLPFVAGMALAYLFNPLANRLERLGIGRLAASLAIIGLFLLAFIVLILLIAPILAGQLAAFIDNLPSYVRRLQAVLADPSWPWLQSVLGDKVTTPDASVGDLVAQGAGWLAAF